MAFEDIATEGKRDLGFLLSEAEFGRSRDEVTIASGAGVLPPGTLLGKVGVSDKFVVATDGAGDGSENAAGILAYATDATNADAQAVIIARSAQVKRPMLVFADGATEDTMIADLAAVGIIAR